jgi:hypothetical protein
MLPCGGGVAVVNRLDQLYKNKNNNSLLNYLQVLVNHTT